MKKQILKTIRMLREVKDIDLKTTPVVFKWYYEEEPNVEIQMLIKEKETIH